MQTINTLEIRPYQLLCLVCRQGRKNPAAEPYFMEAQLDRIQAAVRADPTLPLTLRCNTASVFRYQNPGRADDTPEGPLYNDLRDLTILQRLGLTPGANRPAIDCFSGIPDAIPACLGVCAYPAQEAPGWPACRYAASGNYERGLAAGLDRIVPQRTESEKQAVKRESAQVVAAAARLRIRPHHLLCMVCFHAGRPAAEIDPIPADNLAEAIAAIQRNPELPVELIQGPCMICPPCSAYDAPSNLCLGNKSMSLRDEKKDLDTLRRIGLKYGDVRPARELFQRVLDAIRATTEVCGFGDGQERAREWRVCGGAGGKTVYRQARQVGLGIPGVKISD